MPVWNPAYAEWSVEIGHVEFFDVIWQLLTQKYEHEAFAS